MNREKFETLVISAIAKLPPEFRSKLENVDVVVEDRPSPGQLKELKISQIAPSCRVEISG